MWQRNGNDESYVVIPRNFFIFFPSSLSSVHTYGLSVMILPSGSEPGRRETGTVHSPQLQCCAAVSTVYLIFTKLASPNRPTASLCRALARASGGLRSGIPCCASLAIQYYSIVQFSLERRRAPFQPFSPAASQLDTHHCDRTRYFGTAAMSSSNTCRVPAPVLTVLSSCIPIGYHPHADVINS